MPATTWFTKFEFDLPSALLRDLTTLLDSMPKAFLNPEMASQLPEAQGVYQLFYKKKLVYIGKTDSEAGLRSRLERHAKKIQHRPSLDANAVEFKAVQILVFAAMDLETQLINHYKKLNGSRPSWNGSGFGANDPGRERDTTKIKDTGFDALHPISIDLPTDLVQPSTYNVAAALKILKDELPYTLRFAGGRSPHQDLKAATIVIAQPGHTVRELLELIKAALSTDWQITVFPSHVILYKEKKKYDHGVVI